MSDLNYGLGFYLIEVATNHYDLYNTVTDNKILEAQPKEEIINFLELNLPTHPFLHQVDQENAWGSFTSTTDDELNKYLEEIAKHEKDSSVNDPAYYLNDKYRFNFNNYTVTTDDEHFYNSFNYGDSDDYFIVDEDGLRRECTDNAQLEFDFTYENNKSTSKDITPKNSPVNEDEKIPYLPDDTEGDTDQGKNINKGIERTINQPSPQSYAGFFILLYIGSKGS